MKVSLKILIVDDMPAMRSILKGMLHSIGMNKVVEAEDGETAWQLIHDSAMDGADPFQLVISDWNMPGMSGVDLLRSVRSFTLTRDVPFFMVTAEGDQVHLSDAVRAGVTDYVVKPFDPGQLSGTINKLFVSA